MLQLHEEDRYFVSLYTIVFMRTAHCWVIMQRIAVIPYGRLGTTYRYSRQGLKMGQTGCPETSVRNYRYLLRNNPEERSS
jgi:hypothetical protein